MLNIKKQNIYTTSLPYSPKIKLLIPKLLQLIAINGVSFMTFKRQNKYHFQGFDFCLQSAIVLCCECESVNIGVILDIFYNTQSGVIIVILLRSDIVSNLRKSYTYW